MAPGFLAPPAYNLWRYITTESYITTIYCITTESYITETWTRTGSPWNG